MALKAPTWRTEKAFWREGHLRVAGVDEVGRGPLAGPVVAGAVVLPQSRAKGVRALRDSKMLTAAAREELAAEIRERADWGIGIVSPQVIDQINILRATRLAMRRAVLAIAPLPDLVLVDAFRIPNLPLAQRGVLHGDRRCTAIAAASIVAKVTRDRAMLAYHSSDPRYGYDRHKGYATADHLAALALHGYSALHRRSFRPQSLFDTME